MSKKTTFVVCVFGGLFILLLFLLGTKGLQFGKMAKAGKTMKQQPESVSTSFAKYQSWPRQLRAIGSIEPIKGVRLDAEVSGIVSVINFENGQVVNEGDILVQMDIAPEAALLQSNKANAQLAKIELDRAQRLFDTKSVAKSELDRAQANYDIALAQVRNIEAIIEQKTLRAPFDGRTGIRQINLGQYLSPGAPIVTIQSYDQVFVDFALPQQTIDQLKTGLPVTLTSDAFPEKTFEGTLTALSPQIDPITRTIDLQGTFDNSNGMLRPGLFVNVTVTLSEDNEVLAIPTTAIIYAPYGNSVYKVNKQTDEKSGNTSTTVKQSFVRLGQHKGDFVSVIGGLEEGDEVVSAGAFKLRNKTPVIIRNDQAPTPELNPTPDNS